MDLYVGNIGHQIEIFKLSIPEVTQTNVAQISSGINNECV